MAAELLQSPATLEGTVVVAAHQTHGRGQRGNAWQSEPGQNLTFSLILKPGFLPATRQFGLNMAVALAIYDCLEALLPGGLRIKWPNDIYWKDCKMGGILIENAIQGENLTHSIVGIGLNVNQLDFSGNVRASSMKLISQASGNEDGHDLEILLNLLLESLEKRYLQLRGGLTAGQGFGGLERYYLQSLYGLGQVRRFRSDGRDFEGVITGIDTTGRLAVRENNKTRHFSFKEIEFVF